MAGCEVHSEKAQVKSCLDCRRKYKREWAAKDRQKNPERHKAAKAKYRGKPETRAKEAAYTAQYREDHPEYVERRLVARKESWPGYYEQNAEILKARSKEWYGRNKDRAATRAKAAYEADPDKFKTKALAWSRANPEARRAIHNNRRNAEGTFTAEDWKAVIERQEGRCAHCNTECDLTVDHIIPLARGGTNWPDNIQGLCLSCNCSKGKKLEAEIGRAA